MQSPVGYCLLAGLIFVFFFFLGGGRLILLIIAHYRIQSLQTSLISPFSPAEAPQEGKIPSY